MNLRKAYRRALVLAMQKHGGDVYRLHRGGYIAYGMQDEDDIQAVVDRSLDAPAEVAASHPSMHRYGSDWAAAEAYCQRHDLGWLVMQIIGKVHARAEN